MDSTQLYLLIAFVVLLVLLAVKIFVIRGGGGRRLTPLAGMSLICVAMSLVFGENRLIGYGLIGLGIVLAVVDLVRKSA